MPLQAPPPLSLYIHLPWCVRKCPYCDFNSHEFSQLPETEYVDALLTDLSHELPYIWGRQVETIFIGGGTPSLFSGQAIDRLMSGLRSLLNINPAIETTMEANPGSADSDNFKDYRAAGINRLSIGVQSFNNQHLQLLGRIHDRDSALQTFEIARSAGFDNINIDLMYGLPTQTALQASSDLQQAIALGPEHISHYQLTIEPNTYFHRYQPDNLPDDDLSWQMQSDCQSQLADAGYTQYEISAYSQPERDCQHNMNYWQFGDYVGIGAGAHGKLSLPGENKIIRRTRQRQPARYLADIANPASINQNDLEANDLVFEFMLNTSRLKAGFPTALFYENTGVSLSHLSPLLDQAKSKGLIEWDQSGVRPTELGFKFLNDLQELFLIPNPEKNQPFF